MERIVIEPTDRSPGVDFDFAGGRLRLHGESYPEDAAAFFVPLQAALIDYVQSLNGMAVVVDIELQYFNSSSAKAIMNIFNQLEKGAAAGNPITVNWHFFEDDDTMQEFGEDFAEDFDAVEFRLCPRAAD